MIKITPHLHFNGNCEDAFHFYEKHLGAKLAFKMTWGESPMAGQTPPDFAQKIMHATLTIGEREIMGGDSPPGRYHTPQGMTVSLDMINPKDAERIFQALSERGSVQMPLQETFWASRFGMVTDQFGTPWMVNCQKPK